jgi:hypothetical protein
MARLNKRFYLGSQVSLFVVVLIVFALMDFRLVERRAVISGADAMHLFPELIVEIILLILLDMVVAAIYLVLVYKMWAAIQDGHARASPRKAVAFLFIPLFQAYWSFQVWWGFAKDYNKYLKRQSLRLPSLSEGLFLTFNILPFLVWIPFLGVAALVVDWVIFLVITSWVCDAVNALPAPSLRATQPFGVLGLERYPKSLSLYCVSGEFEGQQVEIPEEGLIIGRNPSRANLVLVSDQVSGTHVRVWRDLAALALWIEDMLSTDGTYYCGGGRAVD